MRSPVLRLLVILALARVGFALAPSASAQSGLVLVPTNAVWRYFKGTAEPSPTAPAAWRNPEFADAGAGWLSGRAPFWYGESGTFGGTGTELTDMMNRYGAVFLRARFTVANPAIVESVTWVARCDDGFVAWLNGRRIGALNAPATDPLASSLAAGNAAEPAAFAEYPAANTAGLLVAGDNVLAVQLLNTSLGSSDIVLDGHLRANLRASGPPEILTVVPAPGIVTNLDRITVTFSEPVTGVRAEDFLVNGRSAAQVQGSGTTYTFTYPTPAFGTVTAGWSTFHGIQDLETPPRRFELSSPGAAWAYEFLDPDGPRLLSRQPPAESTVSAVDQIEVVFDKAVLGVEAADLLRGGVAATNVAGVGAGPYLFQFPSGPPPGVVHVAWRADHGITSDALEPHPFSSGSWSYTVNPGTRPSALVITEFMTENLTSYRDEDQDPEDWVEIWNPTPAAVNLAGWSLTRQRDEPGAWVFPSVTLPAGAYLVVFASGKDRAPLAGRLHTNFKLNPNGGYLGLFGPELPRRAVSEVTFGTQGPDYSAGRENNTGDWRYFKGGSPATRNGAGTIASLVEDVRFSVERGFFARPFNLGLTCATPGAVIRYTLDGSPPTETTGRVFTNLIVIQTNGVVRAAAFRSNSLPSRVVTHSYLVNLPAARLRLPALSLVTATNNLFGRTGIMEVSPRNTTQRGPAWERPVSVEYIRPEDNGGFQTDCGLRLQGGDYVRGQYNYRNSSLPFSKYSYRLYFRGEYGQGRLDFPLFPETTQQSFDTVVLRAGMNDHSNPFLADEFVRTLARDCGQPAALGTFVHLFVNGVYKGYYNPCERIDVDFLRAYHGGGETWDIMAQSGEVREGDATAFTALRTLANTRDLSDPVHYRDAAARLDLVNFIDYLCPLIYVDADDWPHNNWRAARERVADGRYRFYVWDAEWSFGLSNGHGPTFNTIANQLSTTSPPWGGTDIQRIFNGLKRTLEFKLLFADRVHRHFFNGGALTDDRIRARYASVTNRLRGVVSGFNTTIASTWIPRRRASVLQHLQSAGFLASSNAPAFSQHGGRVPSGYRLSFSNLAGTMYYTTNGTDPRLAFTGAVAPDALRYQEPLALAADTLVRARTLSGTNWSALAEAAFRVDQRDVPVRFSEIMYHPFGGEEFEFVELVNPGGVPVDLAGYTLGGLEFRFPEPSPLLAPGARLVLASSEDPAAFRARYPDVVVAGWFDGALNNAGERIALFDRAGRLVTSVTFSDQPPWPVAADGSGSSLELRDPAGAPDDPGSWIASTSRTGTPGLAGPLPPEPDVRLNEVAANNDPIPDWVELVHRGAATANLAGWSLSDSDRPRRFVFPAGTTLAPGAFLRVWCDAATNSPGLHTGFSLRTSGESVALYDARTNRVDIATFGALVPDLTLGRLGADPAWHLTEPTPGAPNEPAQLAAPADLVVNEWLANPLPGQDDWIEIHNTHASLPAALGGLHLGTSNELARIQFPTFVPPLGFAVLRADESAGPGHLPFRLPSSPNAIVLYDALGAELNRVVYPPQTEGIGGGRLPDASANLVALPGTASPGAPNYTTPADGPRFHEILARNEGVLPDVLGRFPDFIEIHNPAVTAVQLDGASLSLGAARPGEWIFPPGTRIEPNGYLVVWAHPAVPASTHASPALHLGRGLPGEGTEVWLFDASGRLLDRLSYGHQLRDQSAGRAAGAWTLLAEPTPGRANAAPLPLGNALNARFNEWFSAPAASGEDWLEVFNPETQPVDLGGFLLTDDPSLAGITNHVVAPLTFIPAQGILRWLADGQADAGPDHLPFRLDDRGETLRLYSPNVTLVDSVDLFLLAPGVSEGRWPDGSTRVVPFPASPSPGISNWLPHDGVLVNEILAHTDPPLEDAVELFNPSAAAVDLSGWFLSNDPAELRKIRIPDGTILAPGSHHVLYEALFNPPGHPRAFTLNAAHGDDVWLSEVDAAGQPTGFRAHARIGASANAESWGRFPSGTPSNLVPLARTTLGADLPSSVAQFRTGTGLPNAYPRIGPVVFSEILYRPLVVTDADTVEMPDFEFVELTNPFASAVPLHDPLLPDNTWRLRGGIEFDFPPNLTLLPGQRAVVLPFSPTNTVALAAFRNQFPLPANVLLLGPFRGRLANEGESLRLERPDTPQAPPHPDAGFVPWLLVEEVRYLPDTPWPIEAATAGRSLQRWRNAAFGNDPANWIASTPTPGTPTLPPSTDRDFDGLDNEWETAHGLDPDNPGDATLDPDADGLSNASEYLAGTNPRDPASVLLLTVVRSDDARPALRFQVIPGRRYVLQVREHPAFGPWQTATELTATGSTPAGPYTWTLDLADASARYFRLVISR